jgi:ATP/maltotriose-dependent transcriptional regulator MalT
MAKVYINQGKNAEAQSLCRRAMDILKAIVDEYHPSIADVLETQVQLHRQMGRTTEAAAMEQQAQEIRARQHVAYTPMAKAIP